MLTYKQLIFLIEINNYFFDLLFPNKNIIFSYKLSNAKLLSNQKLLILEVLIVIRLRKPYKKVFFLKQISL